MRRKKIEFFPMSYWAGLYRMYRLTRDTRIICCTTRMKPEQEKSQELCFNETYVSVITTMCTISSGSLWNVYMCTLFVVAALGISPLRLFAFDTHTQLTHSGSLSLLSGRRGFFLQFRHFVFLQKKKMIFRFAIVFNYVLG